MLEIQKFLSFGKSFDDLKTQYGIESKRDPEYPNLVLFKYNQIESPMHERIVQECRGIILDQDDNWKVISRAFDKFFNYGEIHAAKIDWNSARVQEKLDGSLMTVYFYDGKWRVHSSGSPNASGNVGNENFTFADYFWQTAEKCRLNLPRLNKDDEFPFCFSFELTGPYNRIVVFHDESKITLIGGRYLAIETNPLNNGSKYGPNWFPELSQAWINALFELNIPSVREFPLSSIEEIISSFDHIPPISQEGYVVVDRYFNRVKIKHPGYVALHHMKDGFSEKSCLNVIRNGEISELIAHFPEYKETFDQLKTKFEKLIDEIEWLWNYNKVFLDKKDFALRVKHNRYSSILFAMKNGKIKSIREGLKETNIDHLMNWINL